MRSATITLQYSFQLGYKDQVAVISVRKVADMKLADTDSSDRLIKNEAIFRALSKVSGTTSNLKTLLPRLIRLVVKNVHAADAGVMYLYDDRGRQLVAEASYGYALSNVDYSLQPGEGAAGQCLALCKSLLFPSVETVMEQAATLRPANLDYHAKVRKGLPQTLSMITIPLMARRRMLGVMLLEHYKQHRYFADTELLVLEVAGSWISLLIDDVQSHIELNHSKRSYRELLGTFIAKSEAERKTIAREIHDEVNQLLLSAMLNLEDIESNLPAELIETRGKLQISRSHINQVIDVLRDLSFRLRPPALDELGLSQALDWHINNLSKEAGLSITLAVSGLSQRRPAPIVETELFRIAQEALSNVIKHAQASSAEVKLNFTRSRLMLLIEDNGIGFDSSTCLSSSNSRHNLGILGMRERAERCGGTLKVHSTPGTGTQLVVEIPVSSYDWGTY